MTAPNPMNLDVGDTDLWVATSGSGPPLLLIHGGSEDADLWRPLAEVLTGEATVVRYDRRGTHRSARGDWPRSGAESAVQHAGDAAALLGRLGLGPALVCGGSSGGVVALALACRHPGACRAVLAHEPAVLDETADGRAARAEMESAVAEARAAHPTDWAAAYDAFLRATGRPDGLDGLPTERHEIETRNAEAFCRDDLPELSRWLPTTADLRAVADRVHLSVGGAGIPVLGGVARSLAERGGLELRQLDRATHTPYADDPPAFATLLSTLIR